MLTALYPFHHPQHKRNSAKHFTKPNYLNKQKEESKRSITQYTITTYERHSSSCLLLKHKLVFFLPTANIRNYSSPMKRLPLQTQRKLENSPGSIFKYSFITFRQEVIDRRRKMTENYYLITTCNFIQKLRQSTSSVAV